MAKGTLSVELKTKSATEAKSTSTWSRLSRYTSVRLLTLAITVVVAVFLTIIIANMGGYVDQIRRGEIREAVQIRVAADPAIRGLGESERREHIEDLIRLEEKRLGLDKPFVVRVVTYLRNALLLQLGRAQNMSSASGSRQVRLILLERLPPTLLLFATENLILFFTSVLVALRLSQRYGSFFDKVIIALTPTSAAPGWFYGIFLIIIFAAGLRILPFGGMVDAPPPQNVFKYTLSLLKHIILPVSSLLISGMFVSIYNWRTFFLIYSNEDYVEMAKAKGLNPAEVERRYILRPTLPSIITSFALTVIGLWTGAPILETVFQWPGLGRTLYQAVGLFETPVIVGSTVIFAYLLAIAVFLLDFIYAIVDPRVRIGGESQVI